MASRPEHRGRDDRASRWEPVIGLEVHVQLATASKAFSGSASAFGAPPNALTDPTVLGLPGALPVFNARALECALALGLATGCRIRERSRFARKHYFYPDLPKGYQISQYDEPLCEAGAIEFVLDGQPRSVRLTRIHLEEDAGKLIHQGGASSATSLVDLNRAGVPLVEIVSEPDIRSAAEAAAYMRAIHQLVRYLDISDADMEKGQLRCDANVSLRPRGAEAFGTRTELKNINSFRFVQGAIEHEIARQARILDGGGHIVQETRLWDADAGVSQPMRGKEEAEDYRYFPDPDLPPLAVSGEQLAGIRAALPELPMARWRRLTDGLGLSDDDARTLTADRALAELYDDAVTAHGAHGDRFDLAAARGLANWIQTELLRELNREGISVSELRTRRPDLAAHLAELVGLIDDGTISGKIAKDVFAAMYSSGDAPGVIVDREGLRQISDAGALEQVARGVLAANPDQVAAFRAGKTVLIGFFVGQVMKQTKGKGNPQMVNQLLQKLLGE